MRGKRVFCAYSKNELVAVLLLSVSAGKKAHIELVAVVPAYKGKGIGRGLIAIAEDNCRCSDVKAVTVCTSQKLPENIKFYHRLGYKSYWMGRGSGNYRSIGFRKALDPEYEISEKRCLWHFRGSKLLCYLRLNRNGEFTFLGKIVDCGLRLLKKIRD